MTLWATSQTIGSQIVMVIRISLGKIDKNLTARSHPFSKRLGTLCDLAALQMTLHQSARTLSDYMGAWQVSWAFGGFLAFPGGPNCRQGWEPLPSHLLLDLMKNVSLCSSPAPRPQASQGPVTLQQSMTNKQVHPPVDYTCPVKVLLAMNALILRRPR